MSKKSEIIEFLAREFPQNKCIDEQVGHGSATIKHRIGADELHPGGTVCTSCIAIRSPAARSTSR